MFVAKEFPSCIYLETSVKCNAKCTFCPSQFLTRPDMTWKLAKSVVDQCAGHDIEEFHPFQYADPLVWKYLLRLLEYARKKLPQAELHLWTNADLLDRDMAGQLIDVGVDWITFSVDGATREVYEAHRPPLHFDRVQSHILQFLHINEERGHPIKTRAHFTISSRNDHERSAFRAFWTDKVDEVSMHEVDSRSEHLGGESRYSSHPSSEPCAQPFNGSYIHSNGNVAMCCLDSRPETVLGNLKEQSIEEVWHGPLLQGVRDLHNAGQKAMIPLCKSCSVRN